jgi:ribosome-associated protein
VATPRTVAADDPAVAALHALILKVLDEDQAVEVVTIPLRGKTSIADHMVIASGKSTRQVASMAAKIAERIKVDLKMHTKIEGLPTADWVLIDAQDVIVHLFRPEVRSFYNLEKMWAFDGPSGSTSERRAPPKIAKVEAATDDTAPA